MAFGAALRMTRAYLATLLCLYTAINLPSPTAGQTSTVNGRAEFEGTAVATNPYGIPTLIYNCAKLPAICQNVNRRNPLENKGGRLGRLLGNNHIELHYDTLKTRKDARRDAVCPKTWKRTHPCPEINQPHTVPQGAAYGDGSYPAARYNPNGLSIGSAGYNTIADVTGENSGMIWTCDEWPPAMSIEGGAHQAQTYCTPQSAACAGASQGTKSEQDFQAVAHAALRNRVSGHSENPTGIFTFHFQTLWNGDSAVPATLVQYYTADSGRYDAYQKRSLEPTHFISERFYDNGTRERVERRLTEEEMFDLWRRKLHNNTIIHAPVQQLFDILPVAPPLPIVDISRVFIHEQAHAPVISYLNQSLMHLQGDMDISPHARRSFRKELSLSKRQVAGQCGPEKPCPDGSCCNNKGGCGYGRENCGSGNCTSNCDATALCGKDSAGGNVSCPLNVCCSYYGYCGTDSDFCSSPNPQAPCQQGFGSCQSVQAPSCGGGSANGRSIAYYQVANVRQRQCNRITPIQINTAGLTHLNLAFATIDPSSFVVIPADPMDVALYRDFTGLKTSSLQTWIAIGGWDFNDPGPTQTTWSDLASTSSSRATFISSLQSFMAQYGFQGVDIDWEYPGAADRAGKYHDKQNFVLLLKEMRAAFGTTYGISATLPSSYWYLRWFDPKAMEPYVDFFGLMTYDLHGPWDAQVKQIGNVVLGHTNIPEIHNWTLPLWYDAVDPSKINMGLAYYGRGYTLGNPNCDHVGCAWSARSRPGPCTNFAGVMSLEEVENLIPKLGVQPTLLSNDMMKQLTWSDQWIGYDDLETIAMKKQWARDHCFGGTMIWSIDLYSGSGSGNTPDGGGSSNPGDPGAGGGQGGSSEGNSSAIVYIDPSIWTESNPVISCEPPCTFILPPLVLPTQTTVVFPPYVTSLDVAWSESTGWTSTVETTTLTIPPVTTSAIEVWQYTVMDSNRASTVTSSFRITSSILPPPFTITDNPNPQSSPGVSHSPVTRTITPPPYPYTFTTPTSSSSSTSGPSSTGAVVFPIVTFKPGTPGPICKSGCGKPCLIFCNHPCLLDCSDGGHDFPDPKNPKSPPQPTPTPIDDPMPTGKPGTDNPPTDPTGKDPQDPEEEDEDDRCAYEFDLTAPTYDGPIGKPSPTSSISIAPPPPPPSPSPPPNPTPPSPNPSTESLHCYNSGASVGRGDAIKALKNFCSFFAGAVLDASDPLHRTLKGVGGALCTGNLGCIDEIYVSVTAINGCRFSIDGPNPSENCGRIIRETIDKCDTSSTRFKQGGKVTSNCAIWDFDPKFNKNIFF